MWIATTFKSWQEDTTQTGLELIHFNPPETDKV